jgi:predicted GNAT family acetyltransferase
VPVDVRQEIPVRESRHGQYPRQEQQRVDPFARRCQGDSMSSEISGIQVTDNEAKSRYIADLDGDPVGIAVYERSDDTIVFTHTVVDGEIEGRGVGSTLIRHALDDARARYLTVVPQCAFVAAFIEDHPEYQDLVG